VHVAPAVPPWFPPLDGHLDQAQLASGGYACAVGNGVRPRLAYL